MANEAEEGRAFALRCPLWTAVTAEVPAHLSLSMRFVLLQQGRSRVVPVFRTLEGAAAFVAATGDPAASVYPLADENEFDAALADAEIAGVTHVVVDITGVDPGQFDGQVVPVMFARRALRA